MKDKIISWEQFKEMCEHEYCNGCYFETYIVKCAPSNCKTWKKLKTVKVGK